MKTDFDLVTNVTTVATYGVALGTVLAEFFEKSGDAWRLCKKGREQLVELNWCLGQISRVVDDVLIFEQAFLIDLGRAVT